MAELKVKGEKHKVSSKTPLMVQTQTLIMYPDENPSRLPNQGVTGSSVFIAARV